MIASIPKTTTARKMLLLALTAALLFSETSHASKLGGMEPDARAWEPSVQNSIATFQNVGGGSSYSHTSSVMVADAAAMEENEPEPKPEPALVAATTDGEAEEEGDESVPVTINREQEEDGPSEVAAEMARFCTDDVGLEFRHFSRNAGQIVVKNCTWVAQKPMARCYLPFDKNAELTERNDEQLFLRDYCPLTCGRCPESTLVIPCPPDPTPTPTQAPTVIPSLSTSSDGTSSFTTSSSSGSSSSAFFNAVEVNNRESSANNGKRVAITASLVPIFLLLLLLLVVYCCCCRKRGYEKELDDTDEEDQGYNANLRRAKSTESKGSKLIGFVVRTFNGRKNDPQVDVHKCSSAICDACDDDDLRRIKSVETYEEETC
eukprot:jgi/Psemu1/70044/estExt_Genemark1.C_13220003